jgi:hypothetical protein
MSPANMPLPFGSAEEDTVNPLQLFMHGRQQASLTVIPSVRWTLAE